MPLDRYRYIFLDRHISNLLESRTIFPFASLRVVTAFNIAVHG